MKTKKILAILVLRSELLRRVALVVAFGLLVCWPKTASAAEPMGSAFTYQGQLYDANHVADGLYDFQFKLYDDPNVSEGNQVGGDVNKPDVDVIDGYFTVLLDFNDPSAFNGEARWLKIGVRPGELEDPNAYTTLSPMQEVTPAPYALYSKNADYLDGSDSSAFLSPASDYGRSGVAGSLYEDTTPLTDKYVNEDQEDSITSGMIIDGAVTSAKIQDGTIQFSDIGQNDAGSGQVVKWNGSAWAAADPDSDWTISDSNMYSAVSGDVGIGTTSPAEKLDVNGTVKATAFTGDGSGLTNLNLQIDWGNAVLVSPDDDVAAKYDWLKSSSRDAQMGALSATNRRTLILSPGTYTLTAQWAVDTDYVDVVSLSGNPKDTIVTRADGHAVEQTANDVKLIGFTIQCTKSSGNADGFRVNATDNSDSYYRFMHFRHTYPYSLMSIYRRPVWGVSDIDGTWEFCEADDFAWRVDANKELSATMLHCTAGYRSYGGDLEGVDISGTFTNCKGGRQSFGGCGSIGCDCSGTFIDCEAGDNSFAVGKTFSGMAIRCRVVSMDGMRGYNGFAGHALGHPHYGTFSGFAYNCTTEGGFSFGMGHSSCAQSGRIINCRNGSPGDYAGGVTHSKVSTVTDNGAHATLTTNLVGNNNDLKFTARHSGILGNEVSVKYEDNTPVGTIAIFASTWIVIYVEPGVTLASQVQGWIEANTLANNLVSIENAPGNDGTGAVTAMSPTYLTGGVDGLCFKNNHPWTPTACTADTTVYPFDNGHTYTNEGASSLITWSLPAAKKGMKYTFCRIDFDADKDIRIDPYGTEHIYKLGGADCGAGKWYGSDPDTDAYWELTLECYKDGEWRATKEIGTFDVEA